MTWHSDCRAEEKTILVTGASAGIGYFVAEQLAAAGATVALGCRDTAKAGRLRACGAGTASIVAHPGGALDSLTPSRPPLFVHPPAQRLRGLPAGAALHGKHAGAESIVRATLDPEITGGELWGPRIFGLRGRPHREIFHAHMTDVDTAAELWDACADLTGVDPMRCPALPR
ncbi:hypothetical protein C5E44_15860 [Nocardia nova]|uniref:SDR family NAD(P)-dependent oxidoreductase n=1 Tax=Nocardia nova TaxID=37330 RepID=UPI000CE9EBF5|nr:hypothetical protein C5E44_15860 [Nocardia nova]